MSTIFDAYLPDIIGILNSNKKTVELEVRFGSFKSEKKWDGIKRRFENGINSYDDFYRIKNFLISRYGNPQVIHSEDLRINSMKDVRQTIETLTNGEEKLFTITKSRLRDFTDEKLEIKIGVSSETSIVSKEKFTNPDNTRIKHRYSWKSPKEFCIFDLTQVVQTEKGKDPEEKYEFEIEFSSPLLESRNYPMTKTQIDEFTQGFALFANAFLRMKSIVQNTDVVYTREMKVNVADFINKGANYSKYRNDRTPINEGEVAKEIQVQARNLQAKDMVYGGLISKPDGINYSVTVKAEGFRKMLVIHNTGLWLIQPPNSYCKVANYGSLHPSWKAFENTVLDGEDIPVEQRKDYKTAKHYYLPFDTIVFKGKNVTDEPLEKRIQYANTVRSVGVLMNNSIINMIMEEKPFYFFEDTYESYHYAVEQALKFQARAKYYTDGLMFTPNNSEYNPQSDNFRKVKKRILTLAPDICKWKPLDKLTIDLAYCVQASERCLCAGYRSDLIKFEGTKKYHFDAETQVDWLDPIFRNIPNKTIIEFGIKFVDGKPYLNDDGKYVFYPHRIRGDKLRPNNLKVAEEVWNDINDPITLETLKGENITLMRKYHNVEKRNIFNTCIYGSDLIDIGSGNGGDMGKMNSFNKILLIEPNNTNLSELKRRLPSIDRSERFEILNCGGEDYDTIFEKVKDTFDFTQDRNLYISMMLSLSFFFGDDDMLKSLIRTITKIRDYYFGFKAGKPFKNIGVYIVFMTIEGERTLALLDKYDNRIDFPGYKVVYTPENKTVYIHIEGTIVENQTEYLVDLDKFKSLLNGKEEFLYNATKEKFLSTYEQQITSMYVCGKYKL